MCVCNNVHQLPRFEPAHLRKHDQKNCVLHDVPIIRGEHIVGTLIQDTVQGISRYVKGHRIGARV